MITSKSFGSRAASVAVWAAVLGMACLCLLPLLNMVALSFSSSAAATGNLVGLVPVDFTAESYSRLVADQQFWRSFGISVVRVALGASLNVCLTVLMAYPLSKPKTRFPAQLPHAPAPPSGPQLGRPKGTPAPRPVPLAPANTPPGKCPVRGFP